MRQQVLAQQRLGFLFGQQRIGASERADRSQLVAFARWCVNSAVAIPASTSTTTNPASSFIT